MTEGGDIAVTSADVTEESSIKDGVDVCIAKYGRIDILINNVGRFEPGGPAEISEKTWDAHADINLNSVYLCCHHVLPLMEKQGNGAVVNAASIAALRYIGKPQVAYSATKTAVIQFTKATAVIYTPKGIRLNVIVPRLMNTPLVGMLADKYAGGDLESFKAKRDRAVPMGKMGESFDVTMTMTAAFLA
ncbi:Fc.00g010380.m01.CDS01 [Cosmosporella sp. VM-42]